MSTEPESDPSLREAEAPVITQQKNDDVARQSSASEAPSMGISASTGEKAASND